MGAGWSDSGGREWACEFELLGWDEMMANGIQFVRLEKRFADFLVRRGHDAPDPISPFEK